MTESRSKKLKGQREKGKKEYRISNLNVQCRSAEARELADRFFFETLVRVHRAGEGAPFTGLKPSGTVEAAIAAADKALQGGSVDELAEKIGNAVRNEIKKRFIEGIHNMVTKGAEHHDGGG